jgi:hypothetical protein
MILKLGTSINSFKLIPNVSSFQYTNKIIPEWNRSNESFDAYLSRVGLEHGCHRLLHNFEKHVFDDKPIFPDSDENDKCIEEYYYGKDEVKEGRVRKLSFIVDNIHMYIYTPFVCYVCNDDGKTFETLR